MKPSFQVAAIAALLAMPLGSCSERGEPAAPVRATTAPLFTPQNSVLTAPITLSLDDIQRTLEAKTPRKLWSIDEQHEKCVPGQRVKLFKRRLKVTPDVSCRIVGDVNRGRMTVSGSGRNLIINMPVNAVISARDIGGVLKGKTATGAAAIKVAVKFNIDRQWSPSARVTIAYGWTEPPGINFLGQRIRFVSKADKRLTGVIAGLERQLQGVIANVKVRPIIAGAWREGFTVIELNRENPPAWMRVTPKALAFEGYRIDGRKLTLMVTAAASTETFVGQRPSPIAATPLPPQSALRPNSGFHFFIPVFADYGQLEPVILRALRKLAARGIKLEGVGHLDARFDKVTVYATEGGRLAVGIDALVEPVGDRLGTKFGKGRGRIWLTGLAYQEPDSVVVRIRDLRVLGKTDGTAANLLLRVVNRPSVLAELENGFREDFTGDYQKVLTAAAKAIAHRQEGDFRLSANVDTVRHDLVQVTGAGLFLPVVVTGKAKIEFSPRR